MQRRPCIAEAYRSRNFVPVGDEAVTNFVSEICQEADDTLTRRCAQYPTVEAAIAAFADSVEIKIEGFEEAEERDVPKPLRDHLTDLIRRCRE